MRFSEGYDVESGDEFWDWKGVWGKKESPGD
jgi:hypothetical protein